MICCSKRLSAARTGRFSPGHKRRNCYAATLAEFGPALFILLLLFFFPVLDLVSICFAYGIVKVLNNNQVHEASLVPAEQAQDPNGMVKKGIPTQWHDSGLGKFVNVAGRPVTEISYRDGISSGDASSTAKYVIVKTTVVCNPAVFVPFPIVKVPALNTPVPLHVVSERPMENPENAG
jgi:hypothetical protein